MTKEEHINYWIKQAEDDWEAVDTLFRGKKYIHSLFFAHLTIEKICKALWIKYHEQNIPPRTHNLNHILSQTPVELSDENGELMLGLNRFNIEGRYPEYVTKLHNICNESFTELTLKHSNELRLCLLDILQ